MEVYSLEDMAAFSLAKSLWRRNINFGLEAVRKFPNDSMSEARNVWDVNCANVHKLAAKYYPDLPAVIKGKLDAAIKNIAKGMLMSLYYKQQLTDVLKDIRYEDIRWKTDFSVDLVTSLCQSKQFNVADDVFCQCCLNRYVKPSWKKLDFCEPAIILDYFGKYHYHALAYYFCYVKKGFHFAWFVTLFDRFFVKEKFIENMFRFSTIIGYKEAAAHYLSRLNEYKRKENVKFVLKCFITENSFKCIRWNNIGIFVFLWRQLDESEQSELVSNHFSAVYRYMVFHRLESLVPIVKSRVSAIRNNEKSHWLLLEDLTYRMSVKKHRMNSDRYYRELVFILWSNVADTLPDDKIFDFLKTSLHYVGEPEYVAMLLNVFNSRRKFELFHTFEEQNFRKLDINIFDKLYALISYHSEEFRS